MAITKAEIEEVLADAARTIEKLEHQVMRLQEMVSYIAANVAATQLAVGLRNERGLIMSPWGKEGLIATPNFSPGTYDVFVERAVRFLQETKES